MAVQFVFDDRFLEAIAHAEHRILGRRLHPYSTWHEFNLQAINSPFLTGEGISIKDCVALVRICSTQYRTGGPVPELRARWWWWPRLWRTRMSVLVREIEAYMVDYAVGPKFWPNQHKALVEGGQAMEDREIDELLEQVTWYEQNTRCGDEAAWNMPLGLLRWKNACFSKFQGADVQIWTPLHDELKKKNDKKREKMIADMEAALVAGWTDPNRTSWVRRSGLKPEQVAEMAKGGMAPERAAVVAKEIYWEITKRAFAAMKK